ncbi:MAG: Rieske (2Fe-2S) protein [Candidatus Velthaea sp.]
MKHRLGKAVDFAPQSCVVREIDGRAVAVWHQDGKFYATRNACPHMGAPLNYGTIEGTMLPSSAKEYSYGMEGHVLRCPWHGYEFSLESGEPLFGTSDQRLITYPVSLEGDQLYIELKAASLEKELSR